MALTSINHWLVWLVWLVWLHSCTLGDGNRGDRGGAAEMLPDRGLLAEEVTMSCQQPQGRHIKTQGAKRSHITREAKHQAG